MKKDQLNRMQGIKIRRQYFNYFLGSVLGIAPIMLFFILVRWQLAGTVDLRERAGVLGKYFLIAFLILLPFIVLSVINRFYFGRTICVLDKKGIHCEDGLIEWKEIERLEYTSAHFRRYGSSHVCFVLVHCGRKTVKIKSAPLYMLHEAKKFAPHIKIKMDIWRVVVVASIASAVFVLWEWLTGEI